MELTKPAWKIKDKNRFLLAAMTELAGSAYISFEGDLNEMKVMGLPGASQDETYSLKRNTIWPRQDFIVLPLELDLVKQIIASIGGTVSRKILHIQIAKNGRLELGVYDNPAQDSTVCGPGLTEAFFSALESQDVAVPRT